MKGKPWTARVAERRGRDIRESASRFWKRRFLRRLARIPSIGFYQKAARAVLKALLPESGTDIKGHMRSYAELLEASGYASRPREFDDLVRILDSEIRLITPTDPEGSGDDGNVHHKATAGQKYYQLTHDYSGPFAARLADS